MYSYVKENGKGGMTAKGLKNMSSEISSHTRISIMSSVVKVG